MPLGYVAYRVVTPLSLVGLGQAVLLSSIQLCGAVSFDHELCCVTAISSDAQ